MNRTKAVQWYVGGMAGLALVSLYLQDWGSLSQADWSGLIILTAIGALSFSVAFRVNVGKSTSHTSITFIPFLASLLLFGPAASVLLAVAIQLLGEYLLRKPPVKAIFNVAQWVVTSSLAGFVFLSVAAGMGIAGVPFLLSIEDGQILVPFAAAVLTFFTVNYFAVAGAIALDKRLSFPDVLSSIAGSAGANLFYGILISPLALVVALLYAHIGVWGFVISLLPLIFIRRSYLTNLKLARANRDLLKALVKAIETRDPYTSGHSLRVSSLAKRIAAALNLTTRRAEQIETAALLHDIGKIDASYTDILRKPDALSVEERQVIESHVTKGVELLESLTSLDAPIIAAVRHHHEREDGKGYPDGLRSDQIPIGAKIIKVCDAVDAMLSDRPYRKALSLGQVREQLITYAGTQFDIRVIQAVIANNVLEDHQEDVRRWAGKDVFENIGDPLQVKMRSQEIRNRSVVSFLASSVLKGRSSSTTSNN